MWRRKVNQQLGDNLDDVFIVRLMCMGRNWDGMRGICKLSLSLSMFVKFLLRVDGNGDWLLREDLVCRGVVFVFRWWTWYLERPPPRRGSDFCSDMGDRSDDVLDWVPWYIKPANPIISKWEKEKESYIFLPFMTTWKKSLDHYKTTLTFLGNFHPSTVMDQNRIYTIVRNISAPWVVIQYLLYVK
jgi:hypothetical protein